MDSPDDVIKQLQDAVKALQLSVDVLEKGREALMNNAANTEAYRDARVFDSVGEYLSDRPKNSPPPPLDELINHVVWDVNILTPNIQTINWSVSQFYANKAAQKLPQ